MAALSARPPGCGRAPARRAPGRASRPPTAEELEAWAQLPSGAEQLAHYGAAPIAPGAADEFYHRTFADTSLDVNGIAAGSPDLVKTVLPVEARANVSIRLAPGQDPADDPCGLRAAAARRAARRRGARDHGGTARARLSRRRTRRRSGLRGRLRTRRRCSSLPRALGRDASDLRRPRRPRPPTLATGFGIESECNVHAPNENVPEDTSSSVSRPCARSSSGSESLAARAAFSSPLAEELAGDVLERFLRYVRVDTQGAYRVAERPSTEKQLDLSRLPRRRAARDRARRRGAERGPLRLRDAPRHADARSSGSSRTSTRRPT